VASSWGRVQAWRLAPQTSVYSSLVDPTPSFLLGIFVRIAESNHLHAAVTRTVLEARGLDDNEIEYLLAYNPGRSLISRLRSSGRIIIIYSVGNQS
jgi:hypothetical protein